MMGDWKEISLKTLQLYFLSCSCCIPLKIFVAIAHFSSLDVHSCTAIVWWYALHLWLQHNISDQCLEISKIQWEIKSNLVKDKVSFLMHCCQSLKQKWSHICSLISWIKYADCIAQNQYFPTYMFLLFLFCVQYVKVTSGWVLKRM